MAKNYKTISGHVALPVAAAVEAMAAARGIKPSRFVAEILEAAVSAQSATSVAADIASRAGGDEAGDGGVSAAAS